jgi:hypothetical protein
MAATYTVASFFTNFASNKCMLSIFNESASSNVVRVYRMWALNNQIAAVIGVLTNMEIRRLTAASGGTTLTPVLHDTNSPALSNISLATNATVTPTDLFRRIIWSTDEPGNSTMTLDEFECLVPIGTIWQMGYMDSTTKPLTLRPGQGVGIINTGASLGTVDLFMEFTVSAT